MCCATGGMLLLIAVREHVKPSDSSDTALTQEALGDLAQTSVRNVREQRPQHAIHRLISRFGQRAKSNCLSEVNGQAATALWFNTRLQVDNLVPVVVWLLALAQRDGDPAAAAAPAIAK